MRKIITQNSVLLDQTLFSGSSFLLTISLSRILDLEQFGLFSTYILVLFLISSVNQALIIQPMQTKVRSLQQYSKYTDFLVFGLVFSMFTVAILILSLSLILPKWFDVNALIAFGFYTVMYLAHDFMRKYFLARLQSLITLKIDFAFSFLQFMGLIIIWKQDITSLTSIFTILAICLLPIIFFVFITQLSIPIGSKSHAKYLNHHLKEGKWFVLASISQWFSGNIFVISSGIFLSVEALGAFRLVQTVFGFLNIFLQSIENHIIPKVNLIITDSVAGAQDFLANLLKKSLWILIPFLTGMYFFSSQVIIFIGGAKYESFEHVVKGFSILYLFIFLFYPIRIIIRALALNKSFFIGYFFSLVFGVIFSPYLIQHFGLSGAIIGLIASQFILCFVWLIYLLQLKINVWKLYI